MKPVAASRFWDSQNGVVGLTEGWQTSVGEVELKSVFTNVNLHS